MKRTLLPTHAFANKALLLINLVILSVVNVLAQGPTTPLPQNQQKWNTNGNSVNSTDFIGTTNATSLIFRTNNLKALEIDPNADLFLKNLSGTGNGIIRYDNLGKIERIPFNQNFSQVLSSSGVWSEISDLIGLQLNNTDIIQTAPGKVGIGTVSPMEKLHVNGNLRIDGDLLLHNLNGQGEGIIKHDQNGKIDRIPFNNSFTQVLSSSGVWQEISTFTGLQVNNNDIIQTTTGNFGIGTNAPQAKLDVFGNTIISGELKIGGNITFAGNKQISYTPASGGHSEVLGFGPVDPIIPDPCFWAELNNSTLNQFSGVIQAYGNNANELQSIMSMGFNGTNGIIELTGSSPKLLINYMCGKDVSICDGTEGNITMCSGLEGWVAGNVGIGTPDIPYKKLTVNGDVSLANYNGSGGGNQGDGMSGLEILGNNQTPTRRGISLDPDPNGSFNFFVNSNQAASAFNFKNGNGGITLMKINADGNVGIGTDFTSATYDNTYKLAVNGNIRAKKIVVETTWSDFVFEKNYKLKTLAEIENYIKQNGHLPEMPSGKEIETKGGDLGNLVKLQMQKIEELTLYIIEQNKRIEALEKKFKLRK